MTTKPLGTHTHNTIAAIEDLTAIGLNAKMEIEIALQRLASRRDETAWAGAEYALQYSLVRISKMMDILMTLRRGPYVYHKDDENKLGDIPRE